MAEDTVSDVAVCRVPGVDTLALTPTQLRIMLVLQDGHPHIASELMGCLNDDLADRDVLHSHLYQLRKKLKTINLTVLYQYINRRAHHRLVQIISPPPMENHPPTV